MEEGFNRGYGIYHVYYISIIRKLCDQQYVCLNGVSLSYCAVDITFKLIWFAFYLRERSYHPPTILSLFVFKWGSFIIFYHWYCFANWLQLHHILARSYNVSATYNIVFMLSNFTVDIYFKLIVIALDQRNKHLTKRKSALV